MKKLTQKTFFMLLALCLIVSVLSYVFVGIFLPAANEKQSRRHLQEKAEMLVARLRKERHQKARICFYPLSRKVVRI